MNNNSIEVEAEVLDIKGKSATVRVERVITVDADMPAEVSNVGTLQDVRLEFVIPQGRKGETGDISPELEALGERIEALKQETDANVTKVKASETQCSIYSTISGTNASEALASANRAKDSEDMSVRYMDLAKESSDLAVEKADYVTSVLNTAIDKAEEITDVYPSLVGLVSETRKNADDALASSLSAKESADRISGTTGKVDENSANIGVIFESLNTLSDTVDSKLDSGNVTSKGNSTTPIYFDANGVAQPTKNFSDYLPTTGGIVNNTVTIFSGSNTQLNVRNNSDDNISTTAPTRDIYAGVYSYDKLGNTLGNVRFLNGKNHIVAELVVQNRTHNAQTQIQVGYDNDGNVFTYAPSPATTDNTNKIATTSFVKSNLANYLPLSGGTVNGTMNVEAPDSGNKTLVYGGAIELINATPYIDFHFNRDSSVDYTARIIESTKGFLSINNTPAKDDYSTKIATTAYVRNQKTRVYVTVRHQVSQTTNLEYTEASVTIPARSYYVLHFSLIWNSARPVEICVTENNSTTINEYQTEDRGNKARASVCGYALNDTTFYLWGRWSTVSANDAFIMGWYETA